MMPAQCCSREMPDELIQEVLTESEFVIYKRLVRERNWKDFKLLSDVEYAKSVRAVGGMQCPRCGIGVTKSSGCAHMLCRCGFSFNYIGR